MLAGVVETTARTAVKAVRTNPVEGISFEVGVEDIEVL
jgi:hypothetical protein